MTITSRDNDWWNRFVVTKRTYLYNSVYFEPLSCTNHPSPLCMCECEGKWLLLNKSCHSSFSSGVFASYICIVPHIGIPKSRLCPNSRTSPLLIFESLTRIRAPTRIRTPPLFWASLTLKPRLHSNSAFIRVPPSLTSYLVQDPRSCSSSKSTRIFMTMSFYCGM